LKEKKKKNASLMFSKSERKTLKRPSIRPFAMLLVRRTLVTIAKLVTLHPKKAQVTPKR